MLLLLPTKNFTEQQLLCMMVTQQKQQQKSFVYVCTNANRKKAHKSKFLFGRTFFLDEPSSQFFSLMHPTKSIALQMDLNIL